jgi:hypothetical protein
VTPNIARISRRDESRPHENVTAMPDVDGSMPGRDWPDRMEDTISAGLQAFALPSVSANAEVSHIGPPLQG